MNIRRPWEGERGWVRGGKKAGKIKTKKRERDDQNYKYGTNIGDFI
jgi:hypothetical protein